MGAFGAVGESSESGTLKTLSTVLEVQVGIDLTGTSSVEEEFIA